MEYEKFPEAVLVATDFSPASRRAVQLAAGWTRPPTEVTLLHVLDTALAASVERFGISNRAEAMRHMRERAEAELARIAAEEGAGRAETMIVEGVPFIEIVRIANDIACDLIIIGAHSQASIENLLFGGTAEKVVRSSRQPVLCVR
jgi:glycine betaine transporter